MNRVFKKLVVGSLVASAIVVSVQAEEKFDIGVGYSGMYLGDFIQGVSIRGWKNKVGLEATLGHLRMYDDSSDDELVLATGKVMYAPIMNQNSKFYIGLEAGTGFYESTAGTSHNKETGYLVRPFFGSEYRFSEIKELGFSWEVGWTHSELGSEDSVKLEGTSVSAAIHYYF